MAGRQTIVENGHVSALFKALLSIGTALVIAGILAVFTIAWRLNSSIANLDKSITVLNTNYAFSQMEHASFREIHKDIRSDLTNVAGRVSDLERERDRERRDNRSN